MSALRLILTCPPWGKMNINEDLENELNFKIRFAGNFARIQMELIDLLTLLNERYPSERSKKALNDHLDLFEKYRGLCG